MNGKAPAWQVRESARQKFLERIQEKISEWENYLGSTNLYRIFLFLLSEQLVLAGRQVSKDDLPDIPWETRRRASIIFDNDVITAAKDFQRSKEEGEALLAKLLEWTAGEITRPYHSALQTQEIHEPKRIFRANSATDKVPLE